MLSFATFQRLVIEMIGIEMGISFGARSEVLYW